MGSSMKPLSVAAILLSCLWLNPSQQCVAVSGTQVPETGTQASTNSSTAEKTQPSLFDDPAEAQQPAVVTARIQVPHAVRPVDVFSVHPYPMRPPVVKQKPSLLPEEPKHLRDMLLHSGYATRHMAEKPYPIGGWRWQYAYREALRKSHLGTPHTLITAYKWISDITPYAVRETKASNLAEQERYERYQKAQEEYEKTRQEVENEAVRMGLYPVVLRSRHANIAEGRLPAGNWWLTCTRKVPGLTYYWQIPFSAAAGENVNLTLTQQNALVITGGW